MLILTRKVGEILVINDDIKVHFIERRGNHIKLGIDAPQDVSVYRKEIYDRILEGEK